MQSLLRKKLLRELRAAWPRYLALLLMIALAMYLIVSLIGAADTIIEGTREKARLNRVEDGQFITFVPLSEAELLTLSQDGIEVEPMFYLDYARTDGSVLRLFRVRERVDLAAPEAGSLPTSDGEIALEKRYSEEHALKPGQPFDLCGRALTISGVVTAPDYDTPLRGMGDSSVDSANFGIGFVTESLYGELSKAGQALSSEEYLYAYRLNGIITQDEMKARLDGLTFDPKAVADPWFQDYWDQTFGQRDELLDGVSELSDGAEELRDALEDIDEELLGREDSIARRMMPRDLVKDITDLKDGGADLFDGARELQDAIQEVADRFLEPDIGNLREWTPVEDNPRVGGAADDVVINKYASLFAGVIVMALLTYVISVFVAHNISTSQVVIGTLYALGVRRRELTWHYLLLPLLVSFLGGVIGTTLGYSPMGVPTQMADTYAYFSVPALPTLVEWPVILYGAIMPPLIAALVNWGVIRKKLSAPVLQMLRNETKRVDVSGLDLGRMGYIRRFQLRQLLREGRSAIGVVLGIFVCLLLMMIGINAWVMCSHVESENIADTKYEYMYLYKYPEETAPEGGHAAFVKTLKKPVMGYNMDVTLLGLSPDNPFFDVTPEDSFHRVFISSAMAQKYGLSTGAPFTAEDPQADRIYAFTVAGVAEYAPAFYIFMDLDKMRELFDMPEDYYNAVFSDRALDIESGRLYAVSTRADVIKAAGIFVSLMEPMVLTMITASAAIMAAVMFLMIKAMLDHAAPSIALLKLFGYRRRELNRLFLNGNTALILIGTVFSINLSKLLMDAMYPYLVSNVACAINLRFEGWLYAALVMGCMTIYLAINRLLTRRIHKISANEVLKNRE